MDLNFELHTAQLEIFINPARFKVVAAGRRFGKSYLSCVELLVNAAMDKNKYGYDLKNKDVWYVAPTFQQAKDIMWDMLKSMGKDLIVKTLENTCTAILFNGRKILLKGSDNPDSLRGSGLAYVVLDEYASMKPSVWEEAIFPALTDVKGSALFIGTPAGKNHFHDLYTEAKKDENSDWEAWHFVTTDNPTLDPELIEQARRRMSSHAFKQEFMASFSATGGGIFKPEWIVVDEKEPLDGMYYIAVDPAGFADQRELTKGNTSRLDETAIAVVKVHQNGWWVKTIDSGRWNIRETSIRILKHAKDVHAACVGIEGGSLKNAIMPYLEDQMRRLGTYPRIERLTHGGKKKSERISWALAGRFEHGRIRLNKGLWTQKFIDQLLDFPNPLTHDDMPDALSYIDQIGVVNYSDNAYEIYWKPADPIAGY